MRVQLPNPPPTATEARPKGVDLTVVVLTFNEERHLPACLAAIPSGIGVLVVDSHSTDETVAIAHRAGARVAQRRWSGFADQRNFALRDCEVATEWVLFVDADERYQPSFFDWADATIAQPSKYDAFQVPSVLVMNGAALRHAPGYPIYHPRLVRREHVEFVPNHAGHGEALAECRTDKAPLGYEHYFHDGELTPWLLKHVRLASLDARSEIAPQTRRGRLAGLLPRGLPRALARFFYHYLIRQGFRDGRPGFRYALMYAWYELTISLIRASI